MGLKWTDADAEASANRALEALTAMATSLAQWREIRSDCALAAEVRRRDAELWARARAKGRGR